VQVLFDHELYDALESLALAEGRPVGAVVRDAVASKVTQRTTIRLAALERFIDSGDELPSPPESWQSIKESFDRPFLNEID